MDSEAALKLPVPSEKRPSSSPIPPQQLSDKPAELADLIRTPKRLEEHPPRASNRGFALSVTEVSQVALGLQSPTGRSDVDPLLAEEQLGPVSGPCSTPNSSEAKTLLKLPEKYELLCEFLDSMEISVRLLRQKGLMSTFSNICTSIQSSMDRRFTYVHLAQLKCVLPEAIMIKKVLLHDVATCSLKTELQVTLQVDAVARNMKEKSESGRSILPAVFRERLVEFFKNHPEGDEVPVERLPHPFNLTEIGGYPTVNVETDPSFNESSSNAAVQQQFLVPSHMSQSFNILNPHKTPRHFSRKIPVLNPEKTPPMCSSGACPKDDHSTFVDSSAISKKPLLSSPISTTLPIVEGGDERDAAGSPSADDYPDEESNIQKGTPAKLVCTPLRLMADTPEIPTSKRLRTTPSNKSVRRSTRTKLFMTPEKSANDVLDFLPKTLLQSVSFITSSCCGVLALRLLKMFLEMPFCTTISWLMR
ncbi:DNA replication initiation protein [Musa troglodytarum]|uniref:DNA replication initiation protein n=1 Tax=Musa troglodytarum TaxID=320322 RepID=A0A9E7HAH3_9LILI|nr:DNA replication initiation protein [Musa troglodytarum]